MRGPDGGSVHDPDKIMGIAMWERKHVTTNMSCQGCRVRSRTQAKRMLTVSDGPAPGNFLICPRCDGVAGAATPSPDT